MVILVLIIFLLLFLRKIKTGGKTLGRIMVLYLCLYVLFLVFFWKYTVITLHWELGISGSDMLQYFNVARFIASGESPVIIYDYFKDQTIGYLLFVYYLVLCLMWPISLVSQFGVISFYLSNILLLMLSGYNLYDYLVAKGFREKTSTIAIMIYLGNVSLIFTACRLLRDTWILFLFSAFLLNLVDRKKKGSMLISLICMLVSIILRSYTVFFFIPFLLLERDSIKRSNFYFLLAILIGGILLYGQNIVDHFYTSGYQTDVLTLLNGASRFLLSPDIVDSVKGMLVTANYSNEYGYSPVIYLLLSVWNAVFIPIGFIGLFNNKDKKGLKYVSLLIILSFSFIFSFLYFGTNEPRHKLMVILPLIILIAMGIDNIRIISRVFSKDL